MCHPPKQAIKLHQDQHEDLSKTGQQVVEVELSQPNKMCQNNMAICKGDLECLVQISNPDVLKLNEYIG